MLSNYDEEKRNRIMAAFTVAAVVLIAVLFIVLIYQIIQMITLSSIEKQLLEEYTHLVNSNITKVQGS